MKKTFFKSTKSIVIAAAICASLVFGVFASAAGSTGSDMTIVAIGGPSVVGSY